MVGRFWRPISTAACACGLAACGALIYPDKVIKPAAPFSDLSAVQQKIILQAKNDDIYYKIHAKFDDRDAEINLLSACQSESRLKLESSKRTAILLAGVVTPHTKAPTRVPVFGYAFNDKEGPLTCGIYEERINFTPPILHGNIYEDIQVSLQFHYQRETEIPFGEVAKILNGVNATFGVLPAVLTAPAIERVGKNLEREISERFSSLAFRVFSAEFRIGPDRENKTQFMVPLVYKDGNASEKKAGNIVFTLTPMATLSNAQVDFQSGAPRFDHYPFDRFPNVIHPKQDDRRLNDSFTAFTRKLHAELSKIKEEHQPATAATWCDDFARELRGFNLNSYDSGYVLWTALHQGLPKLFNQHPDYSGFNCVMTLAPAIRAAGLPVKTRDQLIAEAKALADEAKRSATQVAAAAKLVETMASTPEIQQIVREVYTEAATAAHAAERAQSAAALGIVPSARTAASEASRVRNTLIERITRDTRPFINLIARDTRVRPEG
jgi:hypothetical protein